MKKKVGVSAIIVLVVLGIIVALYGISKRATEEREVYVNESANSFLNETTAESEVIESVLEEVEETAAESDVIYSPVHEEGDDDDLFEESELLLEDELKLTLNSYEYLQELVIPVIKTTYELSPYNIMVVQGVEEDVSMVFSSSWVYLDVYFTDATEVGVYTLNNAIVADYRGDLKLFVEKDEDTDTITEVQDNGEEQTQVQTQEENV